MIYDFECKRCGVPGKAASRRRTLCSHCQHHTDKEKKRARSKALKGMMRTCATCGKLFSAQAGRHCYDCRNGCKIHRRASSLPGKSREHVMSIAGKLAAIEPVTYRAAATILELPLMSAIEQVNGLVMAGLIRGTGKVGEFAWDRE